MRCKGFWGFEEEREMVSYGTQRTDESPKRIRELMIASFSANIFASPLNIRSRSTVFQISQFVLIGQRACGHLKATAALTRRTHQIFRPRALYLHGRSAPKPSTERNFATLYDIFFNNPYEDFLCFMQYVL